MQQDSLQNSILQNLFTSDTFKCKSGGITTEREKVHDFSIIFNGDKNKPYSQSFEVKSYNI